ncbi:hypothetical protein DV737_g5267, partial [Chaetothyriales sp. CBS 132003]
MYRALSFPVSPPYGSITPPGEAMKQPCPLSLNQKYSKIVRIGPNAVDITHSEAAHVTYVEEDGFHTPEFYLNFAFDGYRTIFSEVDPEVRAPRAKAVLPTFSEARSRQQRAVPVFRSSSTTASSFHANIQGPALHNIAPEKKVTTPQTLTEKILQRYSVDLPKGKVVRSGDYVQIQPHRCLTHDNTWPVAMKFMSTGATKIKDPAQLVFALDHDVQNTSPSNLKKYHQIQEFAKKHGVNFFGAGHGIGHQIMASFSLHLKAAAKVFQAAAESNGGRIPKIADGVKLYIAAASASEQAIAEDEGPGVYEVPEAYTGVKYGYGTGSPATIENELGNALEQLESLIDRVQTATRIGDDAAQTVTKILQGFPAKISGEIVFANADNLDTDNIYAGKYTYQDDMTTADMAKVCMENYDPEFRSDTRNERSESQTNLRDVTITRIAENEALRDVFNKHDFWRDFSKSSKSSSGLIGNKYLTTAGGFQTFAETSLAQCRKLVDRTLRASSQEEYVAIPKDLDRLSDLLCRVIDLSDFIRSNHPDAKVAGAAHASYSMMFQYMNELNTTTGLNSQLEKAWNTPEIRSQWNAEEEIVAKILMKDFAKSGIDLPGKQREQFVTLSNEIAQAGTDFTSEMEPARGQISVPQDRLNGVDPTYVRSTSRWKNTPVPIYSPLSRMIMQGAHDSGLRRELYVAERTASKRTIDRLERLLMKRSQLARLTGHSSYAEMTLADKMAQTPKAVSNFLESLLKSNKGQVGAEIAQLLEMKMKLNQDAREVHPWDHAYLLTKLCQTRPRTSFTLSKSRLYDSARSYFALGHVMQGLSSLFESLYGLRLVPKETQLGETWDPEVRRLDVYDNDNRHIATMYCDLFSRPGKPPNPAHFTLVCSRELSEEEVKEDVAHGRPLNNGMAVLSEADNATGRARHFQIPIIALVCDFPDGHGSSSQPALLSISSVVTLFHEMGHAVHSFLGRTSLQGIAGTRCATDFAELPSILMEYFAMDPNVLKLFARHWQTDTLIPDELIQALKDEAKVRAEMSGGWENENQILMAILDQVYHSHGAMSELNSGRYDSTAAYHGVWNQHASCREPAETAWQGFFGHLYGYGSTYYAYLFDRAIARQVWRAVFRDGHEAGAVDRAADQQAEVDGLERVLPNLVHKEPIRFVGDTNPESILANLSSRAKGSPRISRIGTWVERQKGPNIANGEVINAHFEDRPLPGPKSGEKTPTNVEKYGKGEGGRRTLPAHYRNYLQSVGAFRVLPKATQDALITTYIACIDGILPVLDGGKLLRDYTAGRASIFLIQAVCLVTCKIPEVSGFLRLYENGPLLDPIPFARSLHTGLEAAMKADLEIDRVTKIQILTLMHLHNDGPGGIEEASLHLSHAIHDAWTL